MSFSRREFLGAAAAVTASAQGQQIEIVVPQDGGTPRDPQRIVRVGPGEFRIRASVEEGRSPLTHAVSRIDVMVRNTGAAAEVSLRLDLSGDGSRPNFDTSYYGGMPKRDFIYIQMPGQPWQRVDGKTEGWVASVRFTAPPGDTRVGLAPWYTYADYLAYVRALPSHPHLTKDLIGKSDGGREHWELTITDPGTPPRTSGASSGTRGNMPTRHSHRLPLRAWWSICCRRQRPRRGAASPSLFTR